MPERDPLSVRYSSAARHALHQAIIAHRTRQAVTVRIVSPGGEFARVDRGGRTAHERAFTRAIYYLAWRVPVNRGTVPDWSVKLAWGPIEQRGGRYGRTVTIRVYRRSSGVRHVRQRGGPSWATDDAYRSTPGNRIDQAG